MEKYKGLLEILPKESIHFNELMKNHTTMKVGGNADVLVNPASIDEIKNVLNYAKKNNLDLYVIGNGSNLIVDDNGIRGIVLKLGNKFSKIEIEDKIITSLSGASMSLVAQLAKKNSLAGAEFMSGIPGTIGGGVRMNAGAYGGQISDIVTSVTVIDEDLNLREIKKEDCNYSYRHSIFMENKKYVIVSVKIKLEKGRQEEIEKKMDEYSVLRRTKQPLEYPNSGSIFKRPEGYFVGKLVEDAGLKGKRIGGAMVSEKHGGFIVNVGNATSNDIVSLIEYIRSVIKEKFGVDLNTEVEFIGGNK